MCAGLALGSVSVCRNSSEAVGQINIIATSATAEGMNFVRLLMLLVLGVGVDSRAPPGEQIRTSLRGVPVHTLRC